MILSVVICCNSLTRFKQATLGPSVQLIEMQTPGSAWGSHSSRDRYGTGRQGEEGHWRSRAQWFHMIELKDEIVNIWKRPAYKESSLPVQFKVWSMSPQQQPLHDSICQNCKFWGPPRPRSKSEAWLPTKPLRDSFPYPWLPGRLQNILFLRGTQSFWQSLAIVFIDMATLHFLLSALISLSLCQL
jgi:hypothetical protein